jgi:2-succinyl-6-hydroxy-2,4-cyclohexadiene-1-carboxylate synthase
MNKLKINGVEYAIEIQQDDASLPYLFMLHGFMGDGRVFHPMTEILREACNPITVDLLGHGETEKIYDPHRYREEQQWADIIEIVKQTAEIIMGVKRGNTRAGTTTTARTGGTPYLPFLYGYSMGGRLALKTALQAPEVFGGLILESTNYGISDEAKRADRRQADARRARQIKEDYPAFLREWEKLPLFKSPHKTDEKLENRYKEIHLAQDPKAMAASLEGFGTGAMEPLQSATHYKNSAMIVAGTVDQKYMKISQSLTSYFSEAQFFPISAGHRVHLDNPAQLGRETMSFIQGEAI